MKKAEAKRKEEEKERAEDLWQQMEELKLREEEVSRDKIREERRGAVIGSVLTPLGHLDRKHGLRIMFTLAEPYAG